MIDFTTLFSRAVNYQNLTPTERALLKVLQSMLIGAGASAAFAGFELIQSHGTAVNIQQLAVVLTTTFVFALAHGVLKYLSASNDPQLSKDAAALDATVSKVEGDLSRGNPELVSDLEQLGLSAVPVFEEVTASSMTAKISAVTPAMLAAAQPTIQTAADPTPAVQTAQGDTNAPTGL